MYRPYLVLTMALQITAAQENIGPALVAKESKFEEYMRLGGN